MQLRQRSCGRSRVFPFVTRERHAPTIAAQIEEIPIRQLPFQLYDLFDRGQLSVDCNCRLMMSTIGSSSIFFDGAGTPHTAIAGYLMRGDVMQAGIILCQRNGSSLLGKWTPERVNGIMQQEIVHDVAPGAWEGAWRVGQCARPSRSVCR
jgi:hypothetical protein